MISRIAPTPSGYLHEGNCLNFLVTSAIVAAHDGTLALRIDDMDADRYRRDYVEDVFRLLDWLGLTWSVGPRDVVEFEAAFSQRQRLDRYRTELDRLRGSTLQTYACVCSRAQLRAARSLTCVGTCRSLDLPLEAGRTALRVRVPKGTVVPLPGESVALDEQMGDFVVWRRDDLPAYQLVSVIEDRELGTTHIVRGADLVASSAAQVFLARGLSAPNVENAVFVHHPLMLDADGRKLSKSHLRGGPLSLSDRLLADLRARGNRIIETLAVA